MQTSWAISTHTGCAALYKSVPLLDVVDAPAKLSTVSHAPSTSKDKDIEDKLLSSFESPEPFKEFTIFCNNFSDSDLSFVLKASSPSLALVIASASSLSILTINSLWLKSVILSDA